MSDPQSINLYLINLPEAAKAFGEYFEKAAWEFGSLIVLAATIIAFRRK
jgi:hypothetical protein